MTSSPLAEAGEAAQPALTPLQLTILALLGVIAVISLAQGVANALQGSGDLQWPAARLLVAGIDPYQAYLDSLGVPGASLLYPEPSYPPSAYALLAPLALLERDAANLVWCAVNLGAVLGSAVLVHRFAAPCADRFLLLLCLLLYLGSTPIRLSIGLGQQGAVAFFLALAALSVGQRRPLMAGVLLGLALAKYSIALPFALPFLAQQRLLPLVVAGIVQLGLCLAVAAWLNSDPVTLLTRSSEVAFLVAGLGVGFADVFTAAQLLGLPPLAGKLAAALLIGGAAAWMWLCRPGAPAALAGAATLSLSAAFHLSYESFLLILPLILLVAQRRWQPLSVAAGLFALVLFEWYVSRLLQMDARVAADLEAWRREFAVPVFILAFLGATWSVVIHTARLAPSVWPNRQEDLQPTGGGKKQ